MIVPSRWMRYLTVHELLSEIFVELANNNYRTDVPIEISGVTVELVINDNYGYWWFREWLDHADYPYDYQEPGEIVPENHDYRYTVISLEIINQWISGRRPPVLEPCGGM